MAAHDDQQSNYITRARDAATSILEAANDLRQLREEGAWIDVTNTLNHFVGENEGLTVSEIVAVVFTTGEAIDGLLAQGHGTNLVKVRR